MSEILRVERPGLLTTVQDLGRTGYQQYGVPVSGALDPYALQVANLLAGNARGAAALEITLIGPTLTVLEDTVFAAAGADLSLRLDGNPIAPWHSFAAKRRQILAFGKRVTGARTYLSVAGGLDVPAVMGSRSTFLKGALGGLEGRALQTGDLLSSCPAPPLLGSGGLSPSAIRHSETPAVVRVVLGPQREAFTDEAVTTFLSQPYTVTPQSDRMGYRLEGSSLSRSQEAAELLSESVALGAVQVPPDGLPIILLADRQTTGGYPKIATVISADISVIAQLAPGDTLRFQRVTVAEAEEVAITQEKWLRLWEAILLNLPV